MPAGAVARRDDGLPPIGAPGGRPSPMTPRAGARTAPELPVARLRVAGPTRPATRGLRHDVATTPRLPARRYAGAATGRRTATVRPRRFDQAQELADKFKDGQSVILNLESTERDVARRLIDFASGVCYSLDGSMEKVATGVYLLKPAPARCTAPTTTRAESMALNPQSIRAQQFKTVRQGLRPGRGGRVPPGGRRRPRVGPERGHGDGGAGPCRRGPAARAEPGPSGRGRGRAGAAHRRPPVSRWCRAERRTRPRRSAARCCSPNAPPTPRWPRRMPRLTDCWPRPGTTPPPASPRPRGRPRVDGGGQGGGPPRRRGRAGQRGR